MKEKIAYISGIPTEELASTVEEVKEEGWEISEQLYIGKNLWELILVQPTAEQPLDAS